MATYYKNNGVWKIAASPHYEPTPSLYKKDSGQWRNIKSAWVKKDGKWQQVYERTAWAKDKCRSIVFIGDDIAWGYGLTENQQFTNIIQNHLNGAIGIGSHYGVCRSLMFDDCTGNPFNGGYNGTPKFTYSNDVTFTDVGPFQNFLGTKNSTFNNPAIYMPPNSFIEFSVPPGSQYINVSIGVNSPFVQARVTLLNNTFTPSVGVVDQNFIEFSESNNSSGYVEWVNTSKIQNFFITTQVRLLSQTGGFFIRGLHGYYFKGAFEELDNMVVQVIARNSYAVEDYKQNINIQEIKKSIVYKEYLGLGNYKPIIVIQAGLNDLYVRRKTVAQYKADLKYLAQKLMEPSDTYSPNGEVVLTIPINIISNSLSTVEPRQNYNNAVVEIANELGIHYVDLSALNMNSSHYLADGIHPNYSGSIKIANKYIEDLGLIQSGTDYSGTENEYRHPIRGIRT